MRILVLGSGGREHAIVDALVASPRRPTVFCAPGNGGTALIAENVALNAEDPSAVVAWARDNAIDLVVIGPEGPLVAGVADAVEAAGILVFGPSAAAAQIEGSKTFAKDLMARHNIPQAAYGSFESAEPALEFLRQMGAPAVVKADGLAAGKGVTVAMDLETAEAAVRECFEGRFGEAGARVVIEEYLDGPEVSMLAFTDGTAVVAMEPAQDHKRAYDNDEGPNTGGMGVYSPVPTAGPRALNRMRYIMQDTVDAMRREGIEYRGVLYGGFILTEGGVKVLEFNARFGDPETQVILPRLKTDLLEVMLAVAERRLTGTKLEWNDGVGVSVVLASGGYPGDYETGKEIVGLETASMLGGVKIYHAGTTLAEDGRLVTAGGRVLNVTALADDFEVARRLAYAVIGMISFEGMHYRTDIARRAIEEG